MKRITQLAGLIFGAAAFAVNAQTYTITGNLTNQGNARILLSYREDNQVFTNSAFATNGAFTLSGPAPRQVVVATLNTGVDRNIHLGLTKQSMYLAAAPLVVVLATNSNLKISGNAVNLDLATVEGDEQNQAFSELRQAESPHLLEAERLRHEFADIKIAGDEDRLKELGPKMMENRLALVTVQTNFISSHPSAVASVWLLSRLDRDYPPGEYKKAFESLAPELRNSDLGRQVAFHLANPPAPKRPRGTNSVGTAAK